MGMIRTDYGVCLHDVFVGSRKWISVQRYARRPTRTNLVFCSKLLRASTEPKLTLCGDNNMFVRRSFVQVGSRAVGTLSITPHGAVLRLVCTMAIVF